MTPQPMRIVHVIGSGLAGSWAVHPLRGLQEQGHAVHAICPGEGPLAAVLERAGIPTSKARFPRRLVDLFSVGRCVVDLFRLLKAIRPDVVHYHLTHAIFLGRIAAWAARVPVRISAWPGPAPLLRWPVRTVDLVTAWMDSAIIASSTATREMYRSGPYAHKVQLIYYGFPLAPFSPSLDGAEVRAKWGAHSTDFVVALVAYLYPPTTQLYNGRGLKGHEVLLDAAKEIDRMGLRQVRFWIVGGPLNEAGRAYQEALQERVRALGLEDRVHFTGFIKDIPRLLAAVDLAVVPSFTENCGGAVEPLLMKKPVVASNVGGLPDVVKNDETGFLVPAGDSRALANAIARVAAMPSDKRMRMGERGRRIVRELFDIDVTVRQLSELYGRLAPRRI